jgi:hypothetical protein
VKLFACILQLKINNIPLILGKEFLFSSNEFVNNLSRILLNQRVIPFQAHFDQLVNHGLSLIPWHNSQVPGNHGNAKQLLPLTPILGKV